MPLSPYTLFWGSAAVGFSIVGAWLLDRQCRRTGTTGNMALWVGPALALLLVFGGAKLHALAADPLKLLEALQNGTLLHALRESGQRIGGGLVLATAFLGIGLPRLCRYRLTGGKILDSMAPLSGLTMALGRVGCFLAGCCFGSLCEIGFCMTYAEGSPAWWNHYARGLLSTDSLRSLSVHPLPVYLAALGLVASSIAQLPGRASAPVGLPFFLFVAVFSSGRLVIETWRESILIAEIPMQTEMDLCLLLAAIFGIAIVRLKAQPEVVPGIQESRKDGSSRPGIPMA